MKTSEGRARLAISIAAVAVFAWGFGPLMVRGIDASAGTIVFWRLWIAMPVMLTAAYFTGGRVSIPLLKAVFVPGVIFGVSTLVGFTSYQTTSIANATLIGALQPVLMLFIGPLLFRERSSPRQILLAVIALGGISTVVLGAKQSSGASLHGDALALINLGLFTTYFVRMKQVRNKGIHSIALIAGVFCVAAVTVTPWVLLTSPDLGGIHVQSYGAQSVRFLGERLHLNRSASRTTFGCLRAMRISACAAPDGERRPCSHSCRVRLEMLSAEANSACDMPVLCLASTTSFCAT